MNLEPLIQKTLELLTCGGLLVMAAMMGRYAMQPISRRRRCLRAWIALTLALVALENGLDALVRWDLFYVHITAGILQAGAIGMCLYYLFRPNGAQ